LLDSKIRKTIACILAVSFYVISDVFVGHPMFPSPAFSAVFNGDWMSGASRDTEPDSAVTVA